MRKQRFPRGWDEKRVRRVIEHYEQQTEVEALAEDEAAYQGRAQAMVAIPRSLVPKVRRMIAEHIYHRRAV
jgi:hypothetical protein